MKRSHACLLLCVVLTACGAAQRSAKTKPSPSDAAEAEAAGRAYIDAMIRGDLEAASALMHPQALRTLREILLPVIEPARQAGTLDQFLALFAGVRSAEELVKLSDQQLFASYTKGALFANAGVLEAMKGMKPTLLGSVAEGADQLHVLFRIQMVVAGQQINELEILTLERAPAGWRLQLTSDIRTSAQQIQRAFLAHAAAEAAAKNALVPESAPPAAPEKPDEQR